MSGAAALHGWHKEQLGTVEFLDAHLAIARVCKHPYLCR